MRIHAIGLALLLTLLLCAAPMLETGTLGVSVRMTAAAQAQGSARDALIARAKSLELNTPYVPPPGDPLEHTASGFAKVMCSAVFITGLDPEFAARNVGFFTGPESERAKFGKPAIDRANKTVTVTLPSGVKRIARYLGSQGCVTLPTGKDSLDFKPVRVNSRLPDPSTQPWPMGDVLPKDPLPPEINAGKLKLAIDAAFEPADGLTAAFVVTWKGRLIGERYGEGIGARTPLESWSMGKSLIATLMGVLVKQGVYDLGQPAPIPEWQTKGDPRARIRIADIYAYVEQSANTSAAGSRLRSIARISRSLVSLHGQHQFIPLRRHSAAAVAAEHGGPLPQHRSGVDQLSRASGRREARRRVSVVSAAGAVRQDRHSDDGDGNGSVWKLSDPGVRVCIGA